MISVARGNALVDIQRFSSVDTDGRARITASKGVRYMLTDAEGGSAAADVMAERLGDDLILTQSAAGARTETLTIEDFFTSAATLSGLGASGAVQEYAAVAVLGAANGMQPAHAGSAVLRLAPAQPVPATDGVKPAGADTGEVLSIDDTPEISAVLDSQGSIQGLVENGGYTDDGRPQMMGKADSGVLVHIYRGNELIGQVVADANGDWSFTPRLPLADGRHVITILHEYPDGDVSDFSAPYVINVDKNVPDTPLISGVLDDEGRITGVIGEQTITDDSRPTIEGTAEAHANIIIYDKGKQIGMAKVDADGNWSFTPEFPLADGTHLLSYAAVDRAGNASEPSVAFEFVVDTRAEKINIFVADDDVGSVQGEMFSGSVTDDSTPTLAGSATAGGVVSIYEGTTLLGQTNADVDGTWQFTLPALSEGVHTLHATVTLVAKGESAPSKPFLLTVDLTEPFKPSIEQVMDDAGAVVGLVERDGRTDDDTPTLSGKAEAGSTVHIHANDNLLGSVLADANGSWTFTPARPLGDDSYAFTVKAEDKAGNLSEASDPFVITIDTVLATPPTIDSVYDDVGSKTGQLVTGEETDDYRPDISGTAEAGSTVVIRDHGIEIGRVQADGDGKWTFTPAVNLAEGAHALTAESMTADGKTSLASDRFDFSVVQNGDDFPSELGVGAVKFNTTLVIDTSGSMATPIASVKAALKDLASEYLRAAGGAPIILTMLTMSNTTPVKYAFSSSTDADYVKFIAAVNALGGYGAPDFETAIKAAMSSIKADHVANSGPGQVFILGDAQNSLSKGTADQWQAMLLNPTGNAALPTPIQSSPISFLPFPNSYDYSFHWLATGGVAIDMPTAEMMPEILLGSAVADSVTGNLLDNDAKLTQDGNEYLTQISFEGGTFRVAPGNALVMSNVPDHIKGSFDPATGLLTITTQSGSLLVYMHASGTHAAGDYVYNAKLVQPYLGEGAREETFGYLAVDGGGVSQSAKLHIVLQPSDARDLLKITNLGKDSGLQGDFVTSDGNAGREVTGTLSQLLAAGLKVQVSVDGGQTWQDAVTNGRNWSFVDMSTHSSSWTVQVRVSDGVTHGTQVLSQEVTLLAAMAAPVISSIPDAVGIYTYALAKDGSEMTVQLNGTGAKVGDSVHIQWGTGTYDQVLTAVNIATGYITLNVPEAITNGTLSHHYDFSVTAQIIGQNGAVSVVSDPYKVVGTYTRVGVSDNLLLAPVENVYNGNGFTITTTGSMAKTASTPNSVAGLTLTDSLQANATFTLNKPADYIQVRLSGANNALGAIVRVYDVNGDLMHEKILFGGTTAQHLATFSWTKTGREDIGSFTVTAMSGSVTLDTFTQYVVTHTADTRDPNVIDMLGETFHGSAEDDVVSLSLSSANYFAQATAAVHGGAGVDTLKLLGSAHVLDLSVLGNKVSSMEIIDITGSGHNTVVMNLSNVLNNGGADLFYTGDKSRVQMMIKGNTGDKVSLGDLLFGGVDQGDWLQKGSVVIDGNTYVSYQHSALSAELLVQSTVTVYLFNTTTVGASAGFSADGSSAAVDQVVVAPAQEIFPANDAGSPVIVEAGQGGGASYTHSAGPIPFDQHDFRLEAY